MADKFEATFHGADRTCPLDGKPLLYSLRAPDDTAKMACSDPDCVNAHGMISWTP